MPQSNIAALRIPVSTGALPDVPLAISNLTSDLDPLVIPKFADTGARDFAYSGKTAAQKAGSVCWIQNREGHSYWSTQDNDWRWKSVNRVLANLDQLSGVDLKNPTDSYTVIMDPPATVLPPGNRLISIEVSCVATSIATGSSYLMAAPRLSVAGSGMGNAGSSNTLVQNYIPGGIQNAFVTLSRTWKIVYSGTFDIVVYAINSDGGGYCRFNGGHLDVVDMGPYG